MQKRLYEGHLTKCKIFIHNVPMPKDLGLYTAVRLSQGEFYYFGTYDTEKEAREKLKCCHNGFVIQTRGLRRERGKEWE